MCSINFHIDKRGKGDLKPVVLQINHRGQQVKRSTGVKIAEQDWNTKTGYPKNVLSAKSALLATILLTIEGNIYPTLKEKLGRTITCKEIGEAYSNYMNNRVEEPKDFRVTVLIEKLISAKKGIYSPSRISQLNRLSVLVKNSGLENNHGSINKTWILQFIDYLCYTENYKNSTVKQHLKALISVLGFFDLEIKFKMKEVTKTLKGAGIDVPKPFLSFEQLNELCLLEMNAKQSLVLNMFMFSCNTGCRFSDLMSLTKENITASTLRYTSSKTGKTVEVPMSTSAKLIVAGYSHLNESQVFPSITNKKVNTILTKILKDSEIFNDTVQDVYYSGKNRKEENVPLYKLITFHSSRRSFGSNLIAKGMSFQDVSDLMGISVNTLISYYSSSDKKTRNEQALKILNSI